MRISRNFIKGSLTYTLAGTLPMASAIILLPFYILYLSTSDFGALSVYFAFSLFIQILTTYSFDTSVYVHYHEFKNDRPSLSAFISSAFVLMIFIGLGVGTAFLLFGDFIFGKIFVDKPISFYPYGLMTAATGIFQALFKVHGNLLQTRERPTVFLWSNVVSFSLIVIFTIAGLKLFPNSLMGPVGGRLFAAVLSGSWVLARIIGEFGLHFNISLLKASFKFNLYTFIYQLLQWVINYFDRIIMVFYLHLSEVGIYDFAMKCLLIIEFILNGLHNTFFPKVVSTIMSQTTKMSTPELNRYYHGFISVIMILICGCILVFPWLIDTFVSKPGYKASSEYFPYIALIYVFRALRLFFAAPYSALKFTSPLPLTYIIVSGIKILLTVALVERFGIYGVIASSLASGFVEILLLRYNVRKKFRFQYNWYKVVAAPLLLFVIIMGLEPLFGDQMPLLLHLFYVLACGGVLWWVYRNEIKLVDPFNLVR